MTSFVEHRETVAEGGFSFFFFFYGHTLAVILTLSLGISTEGRNSHLERIPLLQIWQARSL